MSQSHLFHDELSQPQTAIAYRISRRLAEALPGKAILQGSDETFDVEEFAADGQCQTHRLDGVHQEIETVWQGPGEGTATRARNAWFQVAWKDAALEVVCVSWKAALGGRERHYWVIADNLDMARRFHEAVNEWCHEVRGEILVFNGGCWQKDARLYSAIQSARYDELVLRGTLKQDILRDLQQFLASRSVYEQYGVPWKRGILLLGPPGNGKTFCLKALIKLLGKPCLYVKSFKSQYDTDESGIRQVFYRARQSAACLLVLEDLDSLITPENRAFFLNELDGFAENCGIIALATTNHPEKLDRSIVDRPSRFDMKYQFDLPGHEERREYLAMWNRRLHDELRLSAEEAEAVAGWTESFSYAYLKELVLSSITRWVQGAREGSVACVMETQVGLLRQQMSMEPTAHPAP